MMEMDTSTSPWAGAQSLNRSLTGSPSQPTYGTRSPPNQVIVPQELPSQLIDKYLATDANFLQIHDAIKASTGYPTISGLQDTDYPNISDLSSALGSLTQLDKITTIPLPSGIVEQFNHVQQNCEMGIFTEIKRAWLTVDSTIYLWSYDNGSDMAYYDGLTEVIIGVALLKPKPGIFKDNIKYVLCLTTLVEIVLLGIQYRESGTEMIDDLHVDFEPLFTIATDNTAMPVIQGTDDGRIFLGGKDGSLYEAMYQAHETWFRKKSWKINHSSSTLSFLVPSLLSFYDKNPIVQIEIDNSRHILFTRSEKGTIEVYDLGTDGKDMAKVATKSAHAISSQAASLARNIEAENFRTISHICAVSESESTFINLIGFTETGIRIYFSTNNTQKYEQRPDSLNIVHIRLPPGYSAASPPQRPSNIYLASYARSTTIMVSVTSDGRAILWTLSSDAFAFDNQLMELFSVHPISSRVWRMREESKPLLIKKYIPINVGINKVVNLEPPVMITQDFEDQRKFIFLSSQGVHIAYKPRPVDHLKQLLVDNQGFENEAVKSFFRLYGEAQSCCMALSIACQTTSPVEKHVAEWATLAFFRYGGDPQVLTAPNQTPQSQQQPVIQSTGTPSHSISQQFTPHIANLGGQVSTPISSTPRFSSPLRTVPASPIARSTSVIKTAPHHDPAQFTPSSSVIRNRQSYIANQSGLYGQQAHPFNETLISGKPTSPPAQQVQYGMSNKLIGLYLYVARVIRPIWNLNCVKSEPIKPPPKEGLKENISCAISDAEMRVYLEKLNNLKQFLIKNIQFSPIPDNEMPHYSESTTITFSSPNQINPIIERASFNNVLTLIKRCLETIGLLRITYEHKFPEIVKNLSPDIIAKLKGTTFRSLINEGEDICVHLASSLVQKYIEDSVSTDSISRRLNEACPSIFKHENALQAKAHETLIKARRTKDDTERFKLINEALTTFKSIGARANLKQACDLLKTVHAYVDIVNLCLNTALLRDKENIGMYFHKNSGNVIQQFQSATSNRTFYPYDTKYFGDEKQASIISSRLECYRIILDTYEHLLQLVEHPMCNVAQPTSSQKDNEDYIPPLTKEEALNYSKAVLKAAIASDDELAHVTIYDWLYDHQQVDKLLEIQSSYLENYLKTKAAHFGESTQLMDLLWMYYERNGNFRAAAHILDDLAERYGSESDLLKRLEYLSRAIICLKSCQSHPGLAVTNEKHFKPSGELLHDLEEKMEVARLQLQVMENLSQRADASTPNIKEAIKKLNEELLDITLLYNEYAEKFDLPECQLAIVYAASFNDPDLIRSLWKRIFDKELADSSNKPISVRKTLLVNKLQHLCKLYLPCERYFPLDFIIQYLENITQPMEFERSWLAASLLSCGIGFSQLVDIYHKLYQSRDPTISWYKKSIQLLEVSHWLFSKFCESPLLVTLTERRQFTAKCLDLIAEYVIDLQSNNLSDPQVSHLISQFRDIQAKLEGMTF
ncbi:nuclear pore complex protein Nup155 [Tetranychus urticae]|uniref:Nucleoporin Nup133/Nup155-like N-terminal domain-containing protein n=1 Tax=Tetranychus urticae TaxID=32264 RepID=T1KZN0_TETUR|nr:nuclear pore complex protein Nup155 [Tetranychus urticae]